MKYSILSIVVFLCVSVAYAQENELKEANAKLKSLLKDVKQGDENFSHTLIIQKDAIHRASFAIVKTDKKGKNTEDVYDLNLSDINSGAVSYKINKDIISVRIEAKQQKKYIKYTENGVMKSFVNGFEVYAENIDAARSLVDAIKNVANIAEKTFQGEKIPESYEALLEWLKTNIGNETIGANKFEQVLIPEPTNPLRAKFSQNQQDAKGSSKGDEVFEFNWGDLNAKGGDLGIKNDHFEIELTTKNKQKFMGYSKTGKKANNESAFTLVGADSDKMRSIEKALKKFLPLAEKRLDDQKPNFKGTNDAMAYLTKGLEIAKIETLEQALKPLCLTTFSRKKAGKTNLEEVFNFNLADINEKALNMSVSGISYKTSIKILNAQKLIGYTKNGEIQNYDNEIELVSDDLESFRYFPVALEKVIQGCKENKKNLFPDGNWDVKFNWITKNIPNFKGVEEEVKQLLEKNNTSPYAIKYSWTLLGKKTSEIIYECSLKDLNASLVEFDVSGKNVVVNVFTNGKEKIIKTYKDGKPSDYVNALKFQIDDIEKARNIVEAFKQCIKSSEGK